MTGKDVCKRGGGRLVRSKDRGASVKGENSGRGIFWKIFERGKRGRR